LSLPDFATTESILNIPDATLIDSLTLRINNLTHTNIEDLHITLIAPDETAVLVFDGRGGSGDNIFNMWLDERSHYQIFNGFSPFTGIFQPENSMAGLLNKSAFGDWKLSIYDNGTLDVGTLESWSLAVNEPIPEPSTMAMLVIAASGFVVVRLRRV